MRLQKKKEKEVLCKIYTAKCTTSRSMMKRGRQRGNTKSDQRTEKRLTTKEPG